MNIEKNSNENKMLNHQNTNNLFENEGRAALTIFIGKSFKGKSYMLRYLLTYKLFHNQLEFGLVFCKTKFNGDYNFLPDQRVYEGYNEEILQKYINNLKAIKKQDGHVPPNFIVFDDLVGILNNQTQFFINWISTFRHLNTSVYIAAQYLMGRGAISPIIREQTDYVIAFNSRTRRTIEALYENFGGLFPTIEEFKAYFFRATKEQYVAMLYSEHEDDVNANYISIKAPAQYEKLKFEF